MSIQTGIPHDGILSPTLFNIYTADIPPPRVPAQVMAYADDITITSTRTSAASQNTYNHTYIKYLSVQNNLILNQTKQLALCSLQNIRAIWTSK